MLQINTITRIYHDSDEDLCVLNNISFDIAQGEKVALMGASGTGKTTLLQIIGGLDHPSSGTVIVNGKNLATLKGSELVHFRNRDIGFVFQFHHLLPDFSALENVMIPGLIARMPREKCKQQALKLLEDVGLTARRSHHPAELSGGERQRIALARALFNNPALILADEPTGNLDRENTQHFLELVQKLSSEEKQTFLIATHDEQVAQGMDYRIALSDGNAQRIESE